MSKPVSIDKLKLAEIKRRLRVQCGFEKDEIEALYPTEEKARDAYRAFLQSSADKAAPAESEKWEEDDFELPDDAKRIADSMMQGEKEAKEHQKQLKQLQTAAQMLNETIEAEAKVKKVKKPAKKRKK